MKARSALQAIRQFTLTSTRTTELGVFTTRMDVDCADLYFRSRYTRVLTDKGIAQGMTQVQGRPRAKSESERVFVNGQTFDRNTGSWEAPSQGSDDARPDWGPSINPSDPTSDCQDLAKGKWTVLPFGKMLNPTKTTYQGEQTVGGYACHEFAVTYIDTVLKDTMREIDVGPDRKLAVRDEVTKPVEGTLCIAVDDWLPLRAVTSEATFEMAYEAFEKLNIRLPPPQ